jgi:hypothetical protein
MRAIDRIVQRREMALVVVSHAESVVSLAREGVGNRPSGELVVSLTLSAREKDVSTSISHCVTLINPYVIHWGLLNAFYCLAS